MTKKQVLIFILPLILALPFINRAYFVDDSYFVEIAHWLKDHPTLPYHFRTDDAGLQNRGWEENGFVRMVNPLAHHYFLAALLKMGGEKEWFLRLGCVVLNGFAALFIFALARRWLQYPLLATMLFLVTPVQWLTSYSLLIDSTLIFWFLGALYFFISGTEKETLVPYIGSGLFMGGAFLTKYPSLLLIPLTLTWAFLIRKNLTKKWLVLVPWGIGVFCLVLYSLYTSQLYGQPHILAASARMVHHFGWAKVFVFFVFLSGSTLLPLIFWKGTKLSVLIGALVVCLVGWFLASPWGGFSRLQGILLGLWLVTSFHLFKKIYNDRNFWTKPQDVFLYFWLIEFCLLMLVVMDWVAVRYFLIATPAIVFLSARFIETHFVGKIKSTLGAVCGFTFLISLSLAYADYNQASPGRALGPKLTGMGFNQQGARRFYLGDSFTMSYLKKYGWVPCFPETELKVGDLVLSKEVTMPLVWFARRPYELQPVVEINYPSRFPIKVMDYSGSAGFYASVWGALPFTFSSSPWERFKIYEVTAVKIENR